MSDGFCALAAIGRNREIGLRGQLPWHLPGDLKFFRQTTLGHIVLMGRRTWESIGRALPGRENWVLSRTMPEADGSVRIFRDAGDLPPASGDSRRVFVIGGAEIYAALLPRCASLLLTHVPLCPEADAWFPPYEESFELVEVVLETPEFVVKRYRNRCSLGAVDGSEISH